MTKTTLEVQKDNYFRKKNRKTKMTYLLELREYVHEPIAFVLRKLKSQTYLYILTFYSLCPELSCFLGLVKIKLYKL